ncbi:MAG: hypothetical protein LBJ69_01550 [Holosporales bacterium]|jgi:hypothetical protein|nr:hypothetical protein [Holosporales bacterium]
MNKPLAGTILTTMLATGASAAQGPKASITIELGPTMQRDGRVRKVKVDALNDQESPLVIRVPRRVRQTGGDGQQFLTAYVQPWVDAGPEANWSLAVQKLVWEDGEWVWYTVRDAIIVDGEEPDSALFYIPYGQTHCLTMRMYWDERRERRIATTRVNISYGGDTAMIRTFINKHTQ